MKHSVSRISLAIALVAVVLAAVVMSPIGQLTIACFSALVGLVPIVLGPKRLRLIALLPVAGATAVALSAYPGYQQMMAPYITQAKLIEVVNLGTSLGAALDRRRNNVQTLPTSADELDVPLPRDKVADVRFDTKDMFTVVLSLPPVSQGRLVFTAVGANGERTWRCTALNLRGIYRPRGCREDYTASDLPSAGAAQPVAPADRPQAAVR